MKPKENPVGVTEGFHRRKYKGNIDMKSITKVLAVLAILAIAGTTLQGCNTFRGAGKDIQRGGAAIEGAEADIETLEYRQRMMAQAMTRTTDR